MTDYDIVVVGAGPAGSMAAKVAAEKGLDVLLLEKRPEIGTPVRCAEGVGKRHFEKLVKIDKKWIAADIMGAKIYSPDETEVTLKEGTDGKEVGYVLERKIFDRYLVKLAANAGSDVMVKTTAIGLKRNKSRTVEVIMQNLDETNSIDTKIVIGADGVESRVGKWAGIDTTLKLNELESCVQYQLTNVNIDKNYCYFWLGNTSAPGGYIWYFPKGKNTANVGIGVLPSKAKRNPKYYLDNFINNKFPEGEIIEFVAGGEPVRSPLDTAVADNVMLVGDAARHVNPITGGGIVNALTGGSFAAEVAVDSVEKGEYHTKNLKIYDNLWKNDFGKKLARYTKLQHKLIEMDDETLNTIFHNISNSQIEEARLEKLIFNLIRGNPKLLWDLKDVI